MSYKLGAIEIYADANRGVYIPEFFADTCSERWQGIDPDDLAVLKQGHEHEEYWNAWTNVLDNAVMFDDDGYRYTLHHDGDLFLVCDAKMSREQYEQFHFAS